MMEDTATRPDEPADAAPPTQTTDEAISWKTPTPPKPSTPDAKVDETATASKKATQEQETKASKPSALQKAKTIVRKLPDPTQLFLLEVIIILVVNHVKSYWLQTWTARILVPLVLLPTVVAAALWAPTHIYAQPNRTIHSPMKPIPDAASIVAKGEALRKREAAVCAAEEALRSGQLKLEVLRRDVEQKLPPAVTIANMLASESHDT